MIGRERTIRDFLAAHGWDRAERRDLAGDASFRRYERLIDGGRRAVLMDGPPPVEDVVPFVRVAELLAGIGLAPPEIYAADIEAGLLLLEDLGDDLVVMVTRDEPDPTPIYATAVDVLLHLQHQPPPFDLPPYDESWLLREALLLIEWWRPGLGVRAERRYREIWQTLLQDAFVGEPVFVYRDYHAENLIWRPERSGLRRLGLLDFQGAVIGPAPYDLVSLLEDARTDVAPELAEAMIERFLHGRPELDPSGFRTAYAILGAQRNAKILGLFTRLAARDGKPHYLDHLGRVRAHLARDLEHPRLADLAAWCREHL